MIPERKQNQFRSNPHEYILQACGVENENESFESNLDFYSRTVPIIRKRQVSLSKNILMTNNNETEIPDADELELSSLPLIQREEFIDRIVQSCDEKQFLTPSPLTLACLATIDAERNEYEKVVKILLETHLVEYDGLNHESILRHVVDFLQRKDYVQFDSIDVYRDTDLQGPSSSILYEFNGFIVNQDVKHFEIRGIFCIGRTIDRRNTNYRSMFSHNSCSSKEFSSISSMGFSFVT